MGHPNHPSAVLQPGKRGERPGIRGSRIGMADILGWRSTGMSHQEILSDFPELTEEDIRVVLAIAADREQGTIIAAG